MEREIAAITRKVTREFAEGRTEPISVDQEPMGANARSTVGTATDAYDMLRVLFSRLGQPHIGPSSAFSFNIPAGSIRGEITLERGKTETEQREIAITGGMCAECEGLGRVGSVDIDALVDRDKSLNEGAISFLGSPLEDQFEGTVSEVVPNLRRWRRLDGLPMHLDRFGMLLGFGIVVGIVAQALLNMSVVLALVPTKGIPLPFISYGGSSLLPTLTGVGILLNLSQYAGLGSRASFDEGDYEDEWQPVKRARKTRVPRQRASAVARPRYG